MKNLLFFICTLISLSVFGQNELSVSGTINFKDGLDKTTPVVVSLFDKSNNLVKSTLSEAGKFGFKELNAGIYHLQLECEGQVQTEAPFSLVKNTEFIISFRQMAQIQEIKISGKKKNFTVKNGNITMEIANSSLDKLPTTLDLLSKLPYVRIDPNGERVNFVGKGVPLLYLDNQKVDFATFTGISVEDIRSVEIIRNPSTKYESEGKAVIKINLKKSRKDGSKLSISETAKFQKRFSNYLEVNFQKKKNKTEWKMNASYNQINHWESNGFDYEAPSESISSDYIIKSITTRPQTIFGASLYQEINDNEHITLSINTNFKPDKGDNNTITNYSQNGEFNHVQTLNHQDRNRISINSIFNYNRKIPGINANIFAGLQFNRESDYVDYDFYNNENYSGYQFNQFRKQLYSGNMYSGRIDGEKKFGENYNLELGVSYIIGETNTNTTTDFRNSNPVINFKYVLKETNLATYLNLGAAFKKWHLKSGLRMETTNANGMDLIENSTKIQRRYTDWFPNAEISFEQNDNTAYTLNYRKSISRPDYGDLSSTSLYGSPYVEYVGNPNLIPTYSNTLSLNISFKKWSISTSAYSSKNPMGYTLVYDEQKKISKFTNVNFDKELGTSISVDYPFQWKKWRSENSLSLNYDKVEDSLAVIRKSTPYLYFSTNNSLTLWKNVDFLLDGSYITKRIEGLYENNAMYLINLGITSTVSNFDFTVRYNDVFKQMDYIQKMTYDKISSKGTFYGNTPTFSIAVKYNFGKLKKSNYKEKTVNEDSGRL